MNHTLPLTPTGLARQIKDALSAIEPGEVEGEIRGLSASASGHRYFQLSDGDTNIECCCFRGTWDKIEEASRPADGQLVRVRYRKVDYYAPYGKLSLIVDTLKPAGEGELLQRQAQTLALLQAEGLCDADRKPTLPRFPRAIGLIAGHHAEALVDVRDAIWERFPAQIVYCRSRVQGATCVDDLIAALAALACRDEVDVIVIARGGGSVADLYPFSDERLCRAIAACPTPVVTSIGHTRQRPNCDFVAAASAPVPARAAELVTPVTLADVENQLNASAEAFVGAAGRSSLLLSALDEFAHELDGDRALERWHLRIESAGERLTARAETFFARLLTELETTRSRLTAASQGLPRPEQLDRVASLMASALARANGNVAAYVNKLDGRADAISRAAGASLLSAEGTLERVAAVLDARDYLRRGFAAILGSNGRPRTRARDLRKGDLITIRFSDGAAGARIETTREEPRG